MSALKKCTIFLLAISLTAFATSLFGQNQKDTSAKDTDPFTQMVDYLRPGKYHQVLANLVGNRTFKGSRF